MIVVFVVDTSPSMSRPAEGDSGLSRLDIAKMAVENTVRQWRKMRANHMTSAIASSNVQRSLDSLGQWPIVNDQFLLLSTSRQHPGTASCAAEGRLLVGYGVNDNSLPQQQQQQQQQPDGGAPTGASNDPLLHQEHRKAEAFQRELKGLKAATIADSDPNRPFPEDAGGAAGMNQALSAGLQLLSRYRLHNRQTEHFGMGRLPNTAIPMPPDGKWSRAALQPACLVLLTDGACLRLPPKQGGGTLQLKYGSALMPLKEFYQEPFRWDQRIFVLAVGAAEGVTSSTQYLHPHLRTLCEVTGGAHWIIRSSGNGLSQVTESLLKRIAPPMPPTLPIQPEPILTPIVDPASALSALPTVPTGNAACFINAGPVCCFQSLEANDDGSAPPKLRAMLLYASSNATTAVASDNTSSNSSNVNDMLGNPLFCIPESYFPSKKLDTLPPRAASPTLFYSKYPIGLGSKSFDPAQIMKQLHRLDQMIMANRGNNNKLTGVKLLQRDVYICEWLDPEGGKAVQVSQQLLGKVRSSNSRQNEFFPVMVPGAGRTSLSDDGDSFLNIGILHVPTNCSTLSSSSSASSSISSNTSRLATLTLLPPDPHILLPLLLRAAETEHRVLKKGSGSTTGATASLLKQQQQSSGKPPVVNFDEGWRNDLRAYLFRLPPYYQFSIKRALRLVLPASVHSLLQTDGVEVMAMQCYSKECHQKIRQGEQIAKDNNDRLELQEEGLRRSHIGENATNIGHELRIGYGQFDPRCSVDSYLAALPTLPAPWRVPGARQRLQEQHQQRVSAPQSERTALDILGDLPHECLFAYYETRRRWLFGGPGVTIRGLHAEGVRNDGGNVQMGSKPAEAEECPLTLAGVGVSTLNHTTTVKMGEYRERLIFARSPVVGYGSNDCAGVSATTAVDGSPTWSVDDDALPATFFDPKTGEFADSLQARARSKLMVNFGNPYRESRADSLVPEKYRNQTPSMQQGGFGSVFGSPRTSPGSPPQDSFDSVEEGEAMFVRKSPSRKSPKRDEIEEPTPAPAPKRPRSHSEDSTKSLGEAKRPVAPPKPPPPPSKHPGAPLPPSKSSAPNPPSKPPKPPKGNAPPPPRAPPPKKGAPPPPKPPSKPALAQPPTDKDPPPVSVDKAAPAASLQATSSDQTTTSDVAPSPPKPGQISASDRESSASSSSSPPVQKTVKVLASDSGDVLSAQQAPPALPLDLESPDVKPAVDLPSGWMCVWSKSQKRWYFFDTKTNKSVWKWPPE